jgi:tetratricopeptide (TPR) repeat protein
VQARGVWAASPWRRSVAAVVLGGAACLVAPIAPAADGSYGPVARSETLWAAAKNITQRQGGGNVAQMAWALYRANPGAFDGAPGRLRAGVTLAIPGPDLVKDTPPAQALASLTGKVEPPAARPVAPASAAAPVVSAVELQPRLGADPHQWLVVTGTGFAPGVVLEIRDALGGTVLPPARPQSVRPTRLEYAGAFPDAMGRWQVVVRNADGQPSAAQEFAVGQPVLVAATAPVPVGSFAGSPEQAALAAKARAQASAEERYQLLAALEDRYAGDLDYDYPLGTLALDTGRYSEAVFVLQRAVSTRPSFSGARMELARAYYALGDNESARREFTTLRQENPPPAARRTIEQYLGAIDQRAAGYEPQRGVYAELAAGFDSNANGAPDIQNFIGFTLDSRNQATSSPYYGVGVGGSLSHPFAPSWRALGHGLASYRGNPDASFVDSQVARLGGGLEWHPNRWTLALLPSGTYAMLDGQENHQVLAADGGATYAFEEGQIGLSLRYAQQRYTDALAVQDIDTFLYGLSTQTRLSFWPRLQVGAALTAGTDEAIEQSSPFGRDLIGVRASAVLDLGRGSVVFVSLTDLDSDFDGAFFGEPRSDEQFHGVLGYEFSGWRASGWTARVQASYVDNASTVDLYDYDRLDAGVSLRKEFK